MMGWENLAKGFLLYTVEFTKNRAFVCMMGWENLGKRFLLSTVEFTKTMAFV